MRTIGSRLGGRWTARLACLACVALFAQDAIRAPARAGFFEELFGDATRDRHSYYAPRHSDEDISARRRHKGSESAHVRRGHTARPFFLITRNGDDATSIETLELRWDRRGPYRIRAYERSQIPVLDYARPGSGSQRLMCVRVCDGAVVSLAKYDVADALGQHPSCENACPGAETRMYRLSGDSDEISGAVEVGGKTTYAELVARIGAATERKRGCACGSVVAKDYSGVDGFLADPTLRYGDIVATGGGLKIFRGGARATHRANEFYAYSAPLGSPGDKLGSLAAINRMLKTPEPHAFSATVQFGPR